MFKLLKNNYIYILFLIPLFVFPFLQTGKLLDISLHIRFIFLNIFLFLFLIITITKFNISKFIFFFQLYSVYIIFLIFNIIYFGYTADAIYQLLLVICFGLIVYVYKLFFENTEFQITTFAKVFTLLAILVIFYAFYDYIKIYIKQGITHQSIYEIKAGFSHKNILSEVLLVLFPFSLFTLLSSSRKFFRILGAINCIAILFLIIVLITRAVWLAFLLGFVFTLISFLVFSKKEITNTLLKKKITYIYLASALFVILLSLFVYSQTDNFETIKKSTIKIFSAYDSSQHRIELWKRSLDLFKESPIIGNGLGCWRIEILKYGNKNLQSTDNITFYQRPHNDYLWILTEQGIIGFVFYILFILLIFICLIKLIQKAVDKNELIFYWLIYYLLIAYFIFSFFSFPKERIEHNLFLGIIYAFILYKYSCLKTNSKTIKTNKQHNKLIIFILIIISLFSNIFAYTRYTSEIHLKNAFKARSNSNWKFVIKEIENAESFAYQIDPFSTPLRWYSGEAYFNLGNTNMAFNDFLKSYQLNPYHIHVLNNLATSYELLANHNLAIEMYKKAIKISPNFEEALLNISAVYYNLADYDSALFYISKIDTATLNPKYKQFLFAILNKRIEQMIQNTDNKEVKYVIESIRKNNDWIFNIFVKSKSNYIIFDKQLLKDCFYVLGNSNTDKHNFIE